MTTATAGSDAGAASVTRDLRTATIAAWGLLAVAAAMLAFTPTRTLADRLLTDEEGPVELGTFLAFFAAAVWSAALAWSARHRADRRLVRFGYAAFACFCLFAAMEEISWGQAWFDIQTPAWFYHLNEQGETNLHNLPGIHELNSMFVMLFGIAGLAATRLGASRRFRDLAPPAGLAALFATIAAMGALETMNDFVWLGRRPSQVIGTISEAVELLGALACFAYAWVNAGALRRAWRAEDAAASGPPATRLFAVGTSEPERRAA